MQTQPPPVSIRVRTTRRLLLLGQRFQGVLLFNVHFSLRDALLRAARDPRSVNTAVEFSKIRQALALVEAHVNYIQHLPGSLTPDASTPRLKEERSDSSDPEAPGTRGQSSRAGLYAGPTSTVSLLTSVRLLDVSHSSE